MGIILLVIFGIFIFGCATYETINRDKNEKEIIKKMLETYNLELKNGVLTEKSAVYLKIKNYISF